ncbi:unnamed protein product [Caenorhabditis bovis]|uniref:Uncharacterized protein n=1 Tax=Caenorhabditis bovis TaxID=2654633 RepID=A0A8S1ETZ0_9PELO|nr:unnamed protein product [Caenorhabditis bovis]
MSDIQREDMSTQYHMSRSVVHTESYSAGHAAEEFVASAEREKRELQGLNDRLEVYIGRVKQLEEKNRSLVLELDQLRASLGGEVGQIKFKYSDSLTKTRGEIRDARGGTIGIEVKVHRLQDDLNDYRYRYDEARREAEKEKASWSSSIAQASAELESSKSRYNAILEEEKRLWAEQDNLYVELAAAKDELDAAIADRMRLQHEEEGLKAELEFLGRVHVQEITELRTLLTQAPADTREFFRNELALAIRDIKAEYEKIVTTSRLDLETIFQSKVSAAQASAESRNELSIHRQEEIRKMTESISSVRARLSELEAKNAALEREASNLQLQLSEDQRAYETELQKRDTALRFMREDCQTLIAELQALLNTKQTLDTEIAIYRKLVESEENRVGKLIVETDRFDSGEVATRTTFKRYAKGNIIIAECDATGKYVILENAGSTAEDISRYQIRRVVDGVHTFTYTLPPNTILRGHSHIKIYGRNAGGIHSPPDSIVMESYPSWGTGTEMNTILYNREGIERASYNQHNEKR